MKHGKFLLAASCAALLAACASEEAPQSTAPETIDFDALYGSLDPAINSDLYEDRGEEGAGFSLMRRFAAPGDPFVFGQEPIDGRSEALVMDVGVEVKAFSGFPLYRIGIRARNVPTEIARVLPDRVMISPASDQPDAPVLVADLSEMAAEEGSGMSWGAWTYCPDCFDLTRIDRVGAKWDKEAFEAFEAGMELAKTPNGEADMLRGVVTFLDYPGAGIRTGAEARRLAERAGNVVAEARVREAAMIGYRAQYAELVADFADTLSPAEAILEDCGAYEPVGSKRDAGKKAELIESEWFDGWRGCADAALEGYDRDARQGLVASYRMIEGRLAQKADMSADARTRASSLTEELAGARRVMLDARTRYRDRIEILRRNFDQGGAMKIEPLDGTAVLLGPTEFELLGRVEDGMPHQGPDRQAPVSRPAEEPDHSRAEEAGAPAGPEIAPEPLPEGHESAEAFAG